MRCLIVFAFLLVASTGGCGPTDPPPHLLAPERWGDDALAIGWVGHATVLVKLAGTTILTDPAFFDRIGVKVGPMTIGPRRIVAPALPLDRLPPLDAVVITHAHMDSLDLPTLRALPKDAALVAPTDCRSLLGDLGFRSYVELGWGERTTVAGLTIEAVPVRHWGKRWPWEASRGYNGYLFRKDGMSVLFASDTAYTKNFARFHDTRLDVAIFGNGAYDPWIRNHADPEQVWQMFLDSGARYLVPIHWDTFRLGREPLGDAIRRLTAAAGPEANRIVINAIGGEWIMPLDEGRAPR
ncbi:MAG TPA: MBL fold metallo-hydrolase [Candidatus Nitrosopolaris sp.]|nr:MBL fold metallo-hydrolase [Candidatus Nitrosopolaris sp.]